jgi:hypothetical protein
LVKPLAPVPNTTTTTKMLHVHVHVLIAFAMCPALAACQVRSLSEPLEMLPAVTETNLKFDLLDCLQMT